MKLKIEIEQSVINKYSEASFHGLFVGSVPEIHPSVNETLEFEIREMIQRREIRLESVADIPEIREWRDTFRNFGLKPSEYRNSLEQLTRRWLKKNSLRTGIPLVDLYCNISLLCMVPMGGYDAISLGNALSIRFAKKGEAYIPIGETTPVMALPGVVTYADENGIICYGWNYRDVERTKLLSNSNSILFFADAVSVSGRKRAETAIRRLKSYLIKNGNFSGQEFILTAHNKNFNFSR